MAYITKEEVANIRNALKKEFPDIKFSVTRRDHVAVNIILRSGNVDFFANDKQECDRKWINVSRYNLEKDFDSQCLQVLTKINEIAYSQDYYDHSDAQIDYFDTAYYVDISIGSWDKPYVLKESK